MGVPSFFRWLSRKYPKIISPVLEEQPQVIDGVTLPIDYSAPNPNGELDNLYLDMNGIVHPCSHPENKPPPETEDEMLLAVFEYTNRVLNMARPRKVLVIAVDGVAPRAKMNQQRARRFRSAKDAQVENEARERIMEEREQLGEIIDGAMKQKKTWDSNAITPGTPFMDKLAAALRYWCSFKLATDPGWKNLQVIISDATVPGEGEHKIMNFVRSQRADPQYNPNTTHCIYGLDADLIFLGLATHEPHFKVLREDVFAQGNKKRHNIKDTMNMTEEEKQLLAQQDSEKPFLWLHISVLREYLSAELWVPRLPFAFDLERAIDDWVFMCFFCGNDFLPHLPCLDVRENSIDILLDIWKVVLPTLKTYITCDGELNLESVEKLLSQLGSREADIFKTRHIQEVRKQEAAQRRKLQKNMSKGQDRHPTKPTEQLQLYDTEGQLAKGSWNLTTHDMVTLKREIMLANEGDQKAIAIVKAQSDKNDSLMNDIMKEQMDKVVDEANRTNFTAADVMKKKLAAKKRRLEAEDQERASEQQSEANKKIKTDINKPEENSEQSNLDQEIEAEIKDEVEENALEDEEQQESEEGKPADRVPEVSSGGITSGVVDTEQEVKLYEPGYHERYYTEKFHILPKDINALRKDLVRCYIEGVSWVLLYYYQGCASWTWYYPYHYAPLAADFFELADNKYEFSLGEPFLPYEQLMSVLPAASGHTLPPIFRPLMSSPDSEIIDFYPTDFPIDMNGKKMSWQGIALLPFIDEERLLRVVRAQYPKLTDAERSRNVRRNPVLLISNKNANYEKFLKKLYSSDAETPELHFQHFRSGLSGIVTADHEGYRPNSKLSCPIQGGSLPELSTNLFLKVDYRLIPLPCQNKSVILNGFIPSESVLSPYDLDAVMYKYNNGGPRRWNFENDMRNNVVPVGPCGITQYKPRVGGYRSFFFFGSTQPGMGPPGGPPGGPPVGQPGAQAAGARYQSNNGSRYSGSSRYSGAPAGGRHQNGPGGSRYQGGRPQRSGTLRRF
ncbi:probable 5'-3' exoribonuclease 2 [Zygosaccharomyces bailii]|nr:probable 5'-3' exoribonuclease 2 [Zygosaccharomyces bailii]